jgi:hypothetical protein
MRTIQVLLSIAASTAMMASAEDFDCSNYPGSIYKSDGNTCSCFCDLNDITSDCYVCPTGYEKTLNPDPAKGCAKTSTSPEYKTHRVPLKCPAECEGPTLENNEWICSCQCDWCKKSIREEAFLSKGIHEKWSNPQCEDCYNKYTIKCKHLGHETTTEEVCADANGQDPNDVGEVWKGGARAPEPACYENVDKVAGCVWDTDSTVKKTDYKPAVLSPAHSKFDTKTGVMPISCRKKIVVDRTPMFCGPHTSPYIQLMLNKLSDVIDDKKRHDERVPHVQCLNNCISFYAKLQECVVESCDQRTANVGKSGLAGYVTTPNPTTPQFAVLKSAGSEAISDMLYKSSEGAVFAQTSAEFLKRRKEITALKTDTIDSAATILDTYKEFKSNPFIISCRYFANNNLKAALNKGKNVDECMTACDKKYPK